ncbi:ABC transporter permease [Phycisphaerales bacterium AB-hyl4]|uniref:ABC transporter permease n=1 Tax=Natronomicrosphaera hydrolytica TaxID=3242702 RepID=A0ABV4U8S5_9BACT
MNGLQLYIRLLGTSVRSQLQYRASFLLAASGQFLATGVEFLGIWALFARFDQLQGWRLAEVALFYGTLSVAFAIGDALGTGYDRMGAMVRSGDFDRVLVRPRSTVLQIMGIELAMRRVGRLLQGLIVLCAAVYVLDITWTPATVALLLLTIVGGVCLFLGLFVLQGTLTFWTVESVEAVNAFSYGGVTAGQYPITIYADWFRQFFTFIVPLACVSYLPLTLVLDKEDILGVPPVLRASAPLVGVSFLWLALSIWQVGVRRYKSTGN